MGVTTSLKPLARYSLCGDRDRAGDQLSPTASGRGAAGIGRARVEGCRVGRGDGVSGVCGDQQCLSVLGMG